MRRLVVLAGIVSLLVLFPMAVIAQDSTPEAEPEATAGDLTRTIPAYVFPYDSDGLNARSDSNGECQRRVRLRLADGHGSP